MAAPKAGPSARQLWLKKNSETEAELTSLVKDKTWCYQFFHSNDGYTKIEMKAGNKLYALSSVGPHSEFGGGGKKISEAGLRRKYRYFEFLDSKYKSLEKIGSP